jgi:hypothetical protein
MRQCIESELYINAKNALKGEEDLKKGSPCKKCEIYREKIKGKYLNFR